MFGRHRRSRSITTPIALDHQSVPLAGTGRSTVLTPIDDWDISYPIDPSTVLPDDLDSYIAQIDRWIGVHAEAGTLDETTPDLVDRLINDWLRVWHTDVDRAIADGLQVADRIIGQADEHRTRTGLEITGLRADLNQALQDRRETGSILSGTAPTTTDTTPQTLPKVSRTVTPITDLDQAS